MSKWNNSLISYELNKLYWRILRCIAKKISTEKEFNRWIKRQSECIWCKRTHIKDGYFCSKKCESLYMKERFQSFKHNNRCKRHKFQKLTYKNQCWGCYVNEILNQRQPKIKNYWRLRFNGFKVYPTFRSSKQNWNGDKIAFEQFLVDNHIKWFVYVKFYQGHGKKIKPVVVGKSGSMLVNASGSDLNFSTNPNDGPARQFITGNKFEWNYSCIMIKKCKNQQDAYETELKIKQKFDLFGS